MTNLKIVAKLGKKEFYGKTFYDYKVLDEKGYTFSILSSVEVPTDCEILPVMITSYKGKSKVSVCTEQIKTLYSL